MLTGETLATALRRTDRKLREIERKSSGKKTLAVKVLDKGHVSAELHPTLALELVTSGTYWFGFGTRHRISAIERRIPATPPQPEGPILDTGFSLAAYPMRSMSSTGPAYPALARLGAGL